MSKDKKQLPIRFHSNLIDASIDTLLMIFNDNVYADVAIDKKLKSNKKWGAKDRHFVAGTVYEVVRWKRLYCYLCGIDDVKNLSAHDFKELIATHFIHTGVYQKEAHTGFPLFDNVNADIIKSNWYEIKEDNSNTAQFIKESVPDWLGNLFIDQVGPTWLKELQTLNQQARLFIRCNTLLISKEKLERRLVAENITTEFVEGYDDALLVTERRNLFKTKCFEQGLFEVQDANSQLISPFLEVSPAHRCIDACAGAGGKTLHIAADMKNKGSITALDIHEYKLKELKKRAKRNQLFNITTKAIDSQKVIKRLHQSAERVLIDAPCSGLGVIRRNPDAKWKTDNDFVERIKKVQQELLQSYSKLLKPDGLMVYATCSILRSENQDQVAQFLATNDDFELLEDHTLLPSQTPGDGFYMAKLRRKVL